MIRSNSRIWSLSLGVVALVGLATRAGAQDVDAMRNKFKLPVPDLSSSYNTGGFFRGAPGTNSGTPLAFGPNWGDAFFGGGYQNQTRGTRLANGTTTANNKDDGSVSAGFGVGNSTDAVGLEVVATSLSTFRSGFGNRTAFSFKLHRMLDNTSAIAVGVENAFIAGGQKTDGTDSWYAVASKVFPVQGMDFLKAFTFSAGVGNGRFRFMNDVASNKKTVNFFGSGSILLLDQLSAIADYTGQDLNLGLSVVPFKQFPVVFTPAIADVTQSASKSARFTLGVGVGMHFN